MKSIIKTLISYNPSTGEKVGETLVSTSQEVTDVVNKAHEAFKRWRLTSLDDRIGYFKKFRTLLADNKEELARLTTSEMGKPLTQARDDVEWELGFIDWYIDHTHEALDESVIRDDKTATYKLRYEPWGVCAAIAPWNFPVSMASSAISQQLLAGNTVVFKPSEYTTLTQKLFVELLWKSGIPDGVLGLVVGDGEVGRMLVDSNINLVWFTGSTTVGQEIYAKAGKKFIKGVMELGGSSPAIVFADCDLEYTLDQLYNARYYNCGQVCSAVKRLFVEESIYSQVVNGLKKRLRTKKVGDPTGDSDIGPLVSKQQLATLISQVLDAVKKGAKVEIGGKELKGKEFEKGNYYLPTILTNVNPQMRVIKEEVFGPVLPVASFDTEEKAIRMANDHMYGLTAEVFTRDEKRANRVAAALQAGVVGINTDSFYVPFAPIGGYKKSGMGREYGIEGFRELTQIKYMCTKK